MMALIAAFFVWLQVGASGVFVMLTPIFFTMHWIFLLLALLLFLVAIFHLLEVVKRGKVMKSRD